MGCTGSSKGGENKWFDPLGPQYDEKGKLKHLPTGGVEQRTRIFDTMEGRAGQQAADVNAYQRALRTAAGDSGFRDAATLARDQMRGKYLESPMLTRANEAYANAARTRADIATNRAMSQATQAARDTAQQYARAGLGFSTANQQATQGARTAAAARMAEGQQQMEADIASQAMQNYLQNYQKERAIQQMSPQILQQAVGAPAQYLQGVSSAGLSDLEQQAQLVAGLASGGQIMPTQSQYKPGALDYALGIGQVASSFT